MDVRKHVIAIVNILCLNNYYKWYALFGNFIFDITIFQTDQYVC